MLSQKWNPKPTCKKTPSGGTNIAAKMRKRSTLFLLFRPIYQEHTQTGTFLCARGKKDAYALRSDAVAETLTRLFRPVSHEHGATGEYRPGRSNGNGSRD